MRYFHRKHTFSTAVLLLSVLIAPLWAQTSFPYKKPPKVIADILESPAAPQVMVSPTRDRMLVVDSLRHPPIADLAQPMLRLAGLRINPLTNGLHRPPHHVGLQLTTLADGKEQKLAVPPNAWLSVPQWSKDGQHFAFSNITPTGIELWVGDAKTGALRKIAGVRVNGIEGRTLQWMPDSRSLLVQTIPAERRRPPAEPKVPVGPTVQESYGKQAPVPTYEDMLKDPHDEDLWDYYATAQLELVNAQTGAATPVGKPAIFATLDISPDGKHLLVARSHRPYSYWVPASDFPKEVEVWDLTGKVEHKLASLPLEENVPLEGVPTGPRNYYWRPSAPATLVWAEALDGGDPRKQAPYRDHLMMLSAPFHGQPVELIKLQFRLQPRGGGGGGAPGVGTAWGEKGVLLVSDFDRRRRWTRTFLMNADDPSQEPKLVWERSVADRYKDAGVPLMRGQVSYGGAAFGQQGREEMMVQEGNDIYLQGDGASPEGDRPFLDRFDLTTFKSERLFQSAGKTYEDVIAVLDKDATHFLTRYETQEDPPNYFVRATGSDGKREVTKFPDPAPQLRGISKQLVTYKRADGVGLSFTLYLPAGYKEGTRLPTIVWAYPREFTDAGTASQISGSPYRYINLTFSSYQLLLLTQGYAILDGATMPVIGDPETMNNTYVDQVVSSAKAAIDKAVEMGVTDRDRVGVGGHSYGAFMTANLLAHSDLFRAGVARSGAYNRTLTPFGFQSERRTLWEAPDMYLRVSPFMYADKVKRPILLIHGMADDNSGTFPIQSERFYQAIKGNGGNVRYVQLPYEAHGYQALESVEHTLWEMVTWYDKWVKNAGEAAAAGK